MGSRLFHIGGLDLDSPLVGLAAAAPDNASETSRYPAHWRTARDRRGVARQVESVSMDGMNSGAVDGGSGSTSWSWIPWASSSAVEGTR
jgi:hypothetical protein